MARKRDLWIFSSDNDSLEGKLQLSFGKSAKSVVGIEKLVNIFVHIFLTELKSDNVYKDIGTEISSSIGGNITFNRVAFEAMLNKDINRSVKAVKKDQVGALPDESLDYVELLDFSISKDTIDISLAVVSLAGVSRKVIVPNTFN